MEYNKFIYKINKYKSFQLNSSKIRNEHYQKKIDFYYDKINEIVNNIKNKKGGAFTDADLMIFLKPTTNELNEHFDKKANIQIFLKEQKKYEENHKKIINFLNELLESNNLLQDLNTEADNKLEEIKKELEQLDEKYKKEIREMLEKIEKKVNEQKKLSLEDVKTKYKTK
jgi:hypothetical protein